MTKTSRLAIPQPLQANLGWDAHEYDQIEQRNDGASPVVEGAAQHPSRSIKKDLAHEA
jgi:hypothetical protein